MKPIHNKGDVHQFNIEGNMTNGIIVNIKTYREFRLALTGRHRWLEALSNDHNTLVIISYPITYIRHYEASICYELMIGDDKVWTPEDVLLFIDKPEF